MARWALMAAFLVAPAAAFAQIENPVIVSLTTKHSVVLGEPVILRFLVLNCLGGPASFHMGYDQTGAFSIRVTAPDADPIAVVTDKSLNPVGGISRGPTATVNEFAEYRQAILLSQRFQFRSTGVHKIEVELATDFVWPNRRHPYRKSFTFNVVVHERDARVLASVAGDLAVRLLATSNAAERIELATALTYVEDAAAIPAIRQVLDARQWDDIILIPGLRRIDSEATRQLLRELVEATNGDVPRGALPELERAALVRRTLAALERQPVPAR